jgi:hypothetical protein
MQQVWHEQVWYEQVWHEQVWHEQAEVLSAGWLRGTQQLAEACYAYMMHAAARHSLVFEQRHGL